MSDRMHGKTVLISGTTGMAAATAERAAMEGARLFVVGVDGETGRDLAERIRASGGACEFYQADLTDARAAEEAVAQCVRDYGQIDSLFNVVGISGRRYGDGPLHECSEAGWDATIAVNLKTMYLLSRPVLNHMLSRPVGENGLRGAILNMGSTVATSPQADHFAAHAYAAAKGAINSVSLSMAAYYAPYKIRVNVIAPGLVATPMSGRAQTNPEILEFVENRLQRLSGGILDRDEIAKASVFMLSDESRHVTGQVFNVDGGWSVA